MGEPWEEGLRPGSKTDLASEALGGQVLAASDDFFASMKNLNQPGRGVFIPGKYTERGKWMDGWESRRKRVEGNDWCVIKLGAPGKVSAVDIDTNHFLGNHPPFASLEGVWAPDVDGVPADGWETLLCQSPLRPGSQNLFVSESQVPVTHVRLNIFPDGGVARLRVYGDVIPQWRRYEQRPALLKELHKTDVDLASVMNGGRALTCSDMFFSPMENLLLPAPAQNMGEGWETRRKRHPGFDWIITQLGARGRVRMIVLDTAFFKGNYPDHAMVEGADAAGASITDLLKPDVSGVTWKPLTHSVKLGPDQLHCLDDLIWTGPVTHLRLNIYPDGGVSRLRVYGRKEA